MEKDYENIYFPQGLGAFTSTVCNKLNQNQAISKANKDTGVYVYISRFAFTLLGAPPGSSIYKYKIENCMHGISFTS